MANVNTQPYVREIKRLSRRNWQGIRAEWISQVGKLKFQDPGVSPEFAAEEVLGLRELVESVKVATGEQRLTFTAYGAPLLHQGIFLLHKAANVLTAAHDQALGGLPTWSLATGYQAGLFSIEGIIHLLGVGIVSYDRRHFLVDAIPGPANGISKKALLNYQNGEEINVIPLSSSVSHFHRWAVFQRLLNTTQNLPVSGEIKDLLLNLDDHTFADQRNSLHYSHTWQFDDIHAYRNNIELIDFDHIDKLRQCLGPNSPQFSLALGTVTFFLACQLLKNLASFSPLLEAEYSLLVGSCTSPRMKLRDTFEAASGWTMLPIQPQFPNHLSRA